MCLLICVMIDLISTHNLYVGHNYTLQINQPISTAFSAKVLHFTEEYIVVIKILYFIPSMIFHTEKYAFYRGVFYCQQDYCILSYIVLCVPTHPINMV